MLPLLLLWCFVAVDGGREEFPGVGPLLVTKESRRTVVSTASGEITAVDVRDGYGGAYHLQFITMAPSSLFLPVLLHTDMVFYVQSGSGRVTYIEEDENEETEHIDVVRGDIYRLEKGSIFYVQSHPDPTRDNLRIHAIFNAVDTDNTKELPAAAYSNISDLVGGFEDKVLQMGFGVSEETILAIKWVEKPPSIVPFPHTSKTVSFGALRGIRSLAADDEEVTNKKKTKAFNFFEAKPDGENCYGWSTALSHKDLKTLKGSNFGAFMVMNLSRSSMMGPYWNPKATEIAIVIQGRGMVEAVCIGKPSGETKFKATEGDVVVVPRLHPVTQMSYNDEGFILVGFSSLVGKNRPQFFAGKRSALRTLDREVMATVFNVLTAIVENLLAARVESTIYLRARRVPRNSKGR
ncbi:Cupin [Musa troglodytarum]|uniref:Cupin n=1 Tax=Musa troglodytarum TaxID=320322 RepID=A0A9E7GP33_9LILI|nr:Cupin [Musa troglodytarum]